MPAPLIRTRILTLIRPPEVPLPPLGAGLASLRLLPGGTRLEVSYDLRLIALPQVAARLSGAGLSLADGILARMARAWAGFKDENRRDQSEIVHQCCNVPPPRD
jgi:hypothetical protein